VSWLQSAFFNHLLYALSWVIAETLFAEGDVCCVFGLLQRDCAKPAAATVAERCAVLSNVKNACS